MPTFTASYTNSRGKTQDIDVDAGDALQAKRRLRQRGIRVTDIKVKPQSSASSLRAQRELNQKLRFSGLKSVFERRPGIKHRAVFASKMGALVSTGVPIIRSIDLMASQQKLPMFKRALESVSLELNQGNSLGTAMRAWPKVFDRLTIAMVEAGEAGGVLDEALRRLGQLLEQNARLQNKIKGALAYPIAVLVIAIAVFLGMMLFIIPIFADLYAQLGGELPAFTLFFVNVSNLLRSSAALFLAAGLALAIFVLVRFYKTHYGRRRIDALMLKLPLFGDLIQKTATARFCRTFSSLTRAGVPILLSLDVVREITGNSIIADTIANSREDVMQGIPLSVALGRTKAFPDLALSMLSIGEETGEMDTMLSKVADFYEDEVENATKALTSLLEPLMIIVVGGIVGVILVAMYLPIFNIFDQIR
ncbi:type II secretion system F family protein [Cyanobium sp. ATX 6A2]|uniref:type II secretion system F family protein n=1 Tax=Cyanobium sp. ATX 6A2 TaxID=2823700 RepID=UPI0020CF431D|nr:type II secretion system F family protein [Cyanobium sp. ATX 6A2]MCP9886903.1 type II secretion system F family protein [Cyanobium sp. ATX 6A2]